MPTTYTDQFFIIDPFAPPPVGTSLTVQIYDLVDQNDDGDIDRFNNDRVDGSDVRQSYPGDTVTIDLPGGGQVTYTGITFYLADGRQVFTPTDGQVLVDGTFAGSTFVTTQGSVDAAGGELGPVCFAAGTLIHTPDGDRVVEHIRPGDLVITRDSGAQSVRWAGSKTVTGTGKFAPVRFARGAIGNTRPLVVSQQHRIVVSGWRAELFCGREEVLVPARHLVDGGSVTCEPCGSVTYVHLLFDRHQIVFSEGVPSESLDPTGDMVHDDRECAREILALFPQLADRGPMEPASIATVRRFEGRALAD